jgi:multidrug resistance efflux pump
VKILALTLALLPVKSLHTASDVSGPVTQPSTLTAGSSGPAEVKKPTMSVHRGSLTTTVEAQGYFEPINPFEVRIRPKVYGGELTIKSVVANGASIKKGDDLLVLDPETIDKQLLAAGNEVTAAHANLTKAQADAKIGAEQDELAMKVQTETTSRAQVEVKWFQNVDGPNILLEADQNARNAKANVDDQQDELNELKKMYKKDDLTTDTADIVVKRAVRNLENTKVVMKIQQDGSEKVKTYIYPARKDQVLEAAKQADQQLAGLKAAQDQSKVLRETGLVTALANTKAADERFADLKLDKEKLTVKAPEDGVVLYGQLVNGAFQNADERTLRVGEKIAPQQIVMTFYTPGKLRLHLELPETKFFNLHAGLKAAITPVAFPDQKIEGTCDCCPAAAVNTQQGPQYNLTVSCPHLDPKLVPGMRANLKVETPDAESSIVVPNTAIADGHVSMKTDDGFEQRAVVIGKSDGKHTEIKQGLSEGEEIFVEAQK